MFSREKHIQSNVHIYYFWYLSFVDKSDTLEYIFVAVFMQILSFESS